ncbi:NYN domain-containing protein, partial [Chloroflexota bacterium]
TMIYPLFYSSSLTLQLDSFLGGMPVAESQEIICGTDFYRRFVFYFVEGENRIVDNIILPDSSNPGQCYDTEIKYCGKRLPGSTKVDTWVAKNHPPPFILERLHKSEKAVDTQICCDALELASRDKLDRLFLYTNDSDFMPLARTLKSLGVNISLIRLQNRNPNQSLTNEFDTYTTLSDKRLAEVFETT